jgi:hypothetical protein
MAKTQKSLFDNPDLLGVTKDFTITIREIKIAAGDGFLIPICGCDDAHSRFTFSPSFRRKRCKCRWADCRTFLK